MVAMKSMMNYALSKNSNIMMKWSLNVKRMGMVYLEGKV